MNMNIFRVSHIKLAVFRKGASADHQRFTAGRRNWCASLHAQFNVSTMGGQVKYTEGIPSPCKM